MGSYLSAPDKKVYVSEGEGEGFIYATASCQGWRRDQEDAEECIPFFDDNATLFILCDGHGGAEVAKYTVEHLPNFLKNHPLYKKGDYEEALKQGFIDFDAHLRTEEVSKELNRIASEVSEQEKDDAKKCDDTVSDILENKGGESSGSPAEGSSSSCPAASSSSSSFIPGSSNGIEEDDTDPAVLREEASLPLESILDRYPAIKALAKQSLANRLANSPVVKAPKDDDQEEAEGTSSGSSITEPTTSAGSSASAIKTSLSSLRSTGIKKSVAGAWAEALEKHKDDESGSDSDFECQGESSSDDDGDDEGEIEKGSVRTVRRKHKLSGKYQESSDDDEEDDEDDNDSESDEDEDEGAVDEDVREEAEDEDDNEESVHPDQEDRDEQSSRNDEEQDDNVEEAEGDDGDEDDEEDDDDDDDDEEDEEDDEEGDQDWLWKSLIKADPRKGAESMRRVHTAGMDSGCTVVVALVKDGMLYVASSGDSRCIVVMRQGRHIPMSFDHKPENRIEWARITKAGGHVIEGRVNGGLNLSRALGDFTYKDPDLPAKEQMITAYPDVMKCKLDTSRMEYIFLACDGIWNSMRNAEVAGFLRCRNAVTKQDLIDACLDLFRRCIASETSGDGTGCDNMTCIIAKYAKVGQEPIYDLKKEESDLEKGASDQGHSVAGASKEKAAESSKEEEQDEVKQSQKRSNSDTEESSFQLPKKRRCLNL